MNNLIGVGITTKERPNYLKQLLASLTNCSIDQLVIVNDSNQALDFQVNGTLVENGKNLGISKSKNKALQHLVKAKCKNIFLLEDDVLIKDNSVFEKYINASQVTGIQHFNYGPGTPFNRKQDVAFDIHNRSELNQISEPQPRAIIEYSKEVAIALYTHVAGMFSYFTSDIIKKVGFFDEDFFNAWEHVDHTYRIIKAGGHPPFWWFADLKNSHLLIEEQQDAIETSVTAKNKTTWLENVNKGAELYFKKHGHYPNQPPVFEQEQVIKILKQIKRG
jgi:GT2 family glycosyltransferase